jgi:hypothetical protein
MGILFKLLGKRGTQLGVEQFLAKQHAEPELRARILHTAEGSCDEEPNCTRLRGGYKDPGAFSSADPLSLAANSPVCP